METSETTIVQRNILMEILFNLKENVLLIVLIICLSLGGGVVYNKLQTPTFTASEVVNYIANYEDAKESDNANMALNLMSVYVDTMVDFCTSGVVLDRAEYYYSKYLESNLSIDNFIESVKKGDYDAGYIPENVGNRVYFNQDDLSSDLLVHDKEVEESYLFVISVTTDDPQKAREMTRIFAVSIDIEGRSYFEGVNTYIYELVRDVEGVSVEPNNSLIKDLIIFLFLGIAIAICLVYLKTYLDKTVKDKAEFEAITGVNVLSFIEKQEDSHAKQ